MTEHKIEYRGYEVPDNLVGGLYGSMALDDWKVK